MFQILKTQIRREFQEHRALWLVPSLVAALLLLAALFGRVNLDLRGTQFMDEQRRTLLFSLALWVSTLPQLAILAILTWNYAANCLYGERRDRSILFWKSMPVSDAQTVLSKLLVAGVIVPFGVYILTLVTGAAACGIYALRSTPWSGEVAAFWDTGTWLRLQGLVLEDLVVAQLWYAPVLTFVMMVSAWARRNVQLWVLLPPLAAAVLERYFFRTRYLQDVLGYRLGGVFGMNGGVAFSINSINGDSAVWTPERFFSSLDPRAMFGNIDLWLGLLVAAAFLAATVYIRRYRDDT